MRNLSKLIEKNIAFFSCLVILGVSSCQTKEANRSVSHKNDRDVSYYSGKSYQSSYENPKIGYYPAPSDSQTYPLKQIPSSKEIKKIFAGPQKKSQQKRNIVFFMIDAARADFINQENTPHIHKFQQEQGVYTMKNIYSNSVTTYFSTLTFFYGLYGHTRPYLIEEQGYDQGAFNLKILKKNGYKLSLFARPNNYFCFKDKAKIKTNQFENSKFLFSKHPKDFIDGYCTSYKPGKKLSSVLYADLDHDSLSRFEKNLPKILKKEKDGHVFLFFLDGAHTPYSYSKEAYDQGKITLNQPYFKNVKSEFTFNDKADQIKVKNSYINALRSADYQFKRMIDELKKNNIYDNTDIIVFSDHGERMFEKNHLPKDRNKTSHSGTAYNELIRPITIFKLGQTSDVQAKTLKSLENARFSQKDVFPTLFAYWGIDFPEELKKFIVGRNLFKEKVDNIQIAYTPNWDKPVFFSFTNQSLGLKLIVKFYRPQYKSGKGSFAIEHVFDLNDKVLSKDQLSKKVGFKVNSKADEHKVLIAHFKEALSSIVDTEN